MGDHGAGSPGRWLIAIIAIGVIGALTLTGVLYYRYEVATFRKERHHDLAAIGRLKAEQIARWLAERKQGTGQIAHDPYLARAVADWLAHPGTPQAARDLRVSLNPMSAEASAVDLLDTRGASLLASVPEPPGRDRSTDEAIARVLATRLPSLGDLYLGDTGEAFLDAVAPVLNPEGTPIALLVVSYDAKRYLFPLLSLWPTPSETAETLLARRDGADALILNDLRHRGGAALSLRFPLGQTEVPAVRAVLGDQGTFDGLDYRGSRVLADLRPVPGSAWYLVTKIDEAEVMLEIRRQRTLMTLILILGDLLVGAAVVVLWRHRRSQFYRRMYLAEHREHDAQEELRTTLYSIGDGVISTDITGRITRLNATAESLTGWTESEARGHDIAEVFRVAHEETRAPVEQPVQRVLRHGTLVALANHTVLLSRDGRVIPIADSAAPIHAQEGGVAGAVLVFRDQTREREAEARLRAALGRQQALLAAIPDIALETDTQGNFVWANDVARRFYGEDVVGKSAGAFYLGCTEETQEGGDTTQPGIAYRETWQRRADGERRLVAWLEGTLYDGAGHVLGQIATGRDITEHNRADEERTRLEEQLRQARKMEAVGRLAGGVAHDFNNMLSVITGYTEMALQEVATGSRLHGDLSEVQQAARRSADLTRQLLAFARRQTIAPRVLNLNTAVSETEKMLRRLIGEEIELTFAPGSDLWVVSMDPSQVDQVLANLAANSRDAIDGVGRIHIETTNITLDAGYVADHAGFVEGDYVLLTVSDTGRGMDPNTLERVFEPFFTTKELGKGTGLGLATIYGIVKQNNGFINVYSEPGQGTTFRIYLPRFVGASEEAHRPTSTTGSDRGTETILVVEDQEQILSLCHRKLVEQGYNVLCAGTPAAAMELLAGHPGVVHLLVTDVVMSGMNGKELKDRIERDRPAIRVLFMSGYTANVIVHRGVLSEGVHFIQKPFSPAELVRRVREVLDEA